MLSSGVAIELQGVFARAVFMLRLSLSFDSAATFVCKRRWVGAMELLTMPAASSSTLFIVRCSELITTSWIDRV
jgi:hypothetical protein